MPDGKWVWSPAPKGQGKGAVAPRHKHSNGNAFKAGGTLLGTIPCSSPDCHGFVPVGKCGDKTVCKICQAPFLVPPGARRGPKAKSPSNTKALTCRQRALREDELRPFWVAPTHAARPKWRLRGPRSPAHRSLERKAHTPAVASSRVMWA